MAKESKTNAERILDKLKIVYTPHTYECKEFVDGEQIAETLGQNPDTVFKTLVTVGKSGKNYVLVLPVNRELDLKKCAKAVGEKSLEMIHVKDLTALTGYIRGGCSPVGMKKLFPTYIHNSAEGLEKIVVSGGRLGLQVELAPEDLLKACNGKLADLCF